ncbi:DUF5709 domain-containing protein [Acrocarpospora catenulata]|uniref:DUF5709 domain-containing protein n=1 Tax=Acrocarpospora catenulata TaxID=2836182 RepID=UPI001BD9BC23|nr:DUF5709 domain-containing protein [Acrocarpospora catenulata]
MTEYTPEPMHRPEPDPRSEFEDEGIPDLQSGTPERKWAVDPEEEPLPGDRPMAIDDFGTTAEEQYEGEPMAGRLAREVPEEQPMFGPDDNPAHSQEDEDAGDEDTDALVDSFTEDLDPEEPPKHDSYAVGRLVSPDEGAHSVVEPDEVARDIGPDAGGYSAEEAAMHVDSEGWG